MKFSDLFVMIEEDSKLDYSALDAESLKIPYLHGKYYPLFIEEARLHKKVSNEYKALKKFKSEYYLGRCEDKVYEEFPLQLKVLRSDLDTYLDADPELAALDEKLDTQKRKVEMLESFIKSLNSRGFNIKSAIDFMKFKNGIN
jgi:hypothetical protein